MYYAFESDEIMYCEQCLFCNFYGDCKLFEVESHKLDFEEQFLKCPLKIATGVEDATPDNILKWKHFDAQKKQPQT